tara:strand:+ start:2729 stop:2923 length:195 start_codon:yes stop_codon:yes gene_type:complete
MPLKSMKPKTGLQCKPTWSKSSTGTCGGIKCKNGTTWKGEIKICKAPNQSIMHPKIKIGGEFNL